MGWSLIGPEGGCSEGWSVTSRSAVCGVAITLVIGAVLGTAVRAQAAVEVAFTQTPIRVFAHDDGRIAWRTAAGCRSLEGAGRRKVYMRTLPAGTTSIVVDRGIGCPGRIALGGARGLWRSVGEARAEQESWMSTAVAGTSTVANPVGFFVPNPGLGFSGEDVLATAGNGDLLTYSLVAFDWTNSEECQLGDVPCRQAVTGGATYVLDGGRARRLAGAPAAVCLAAGADQVALVPPVIGGDYKSFQRPEAQQRVEVRNATSGALVSQFVPAGTPRGVGLWSDRVAVMVELADGNRAIEIHAAQDGALLHRFSASRYAADRIDISQRAIIFRRGRELHVIGMQTGVRGIVARAPTPPVGFSIEGDKVAWAYNFGGHGHIRVTTLTKVQ
jgi:hypothetical protein